MTNRAGIEQGRAAFAYARAEQGKALPDKKEQERYKSYVKKIPMMIKTNGIGAAFAYMLSKKEKSEGKVYMAIGGDITDWLKELIKDGAYNFSLKDVNNFEDLSKRTVELDSSSYRALTIEVLAFLNWLKRFSEGLIEREATD